MALTAEFLRISDTLRVPTMGTENVAYLLYALTRMLRPRSVLEIGSGYTTLFLALGLADAAAEADADRELITREPKGARGQLLSSRAEQAYAPMLFSLDTLTHPRTSGGQLPEALSALGLAERVTLATVDFRGASTTLPALCRPLDLIWFDCGAAGAAGVDFLNEYWPLLDQGGLIGIHSLRKRMAFHGGRLTCTVPSALLNELLRQASAGPRRPVDVLSLAEPHKVVQSDVALLKKVGPLDAIRDTEFTAPARKDGTVPVLQALLG